MRPVSPTDHHAGEAFYGPFCRLEVTEGGQLLADAVKQALSGEIWGAVPNWGGSPQVQAYGRGLRPDETGIEFWARQAPDTRHGPRPYWLRPGPHLRIEHDNGRDLAKLRVAFVRISQDVLHAAATR